MGASTLDQPLYCIQHALMHITIITYQRNIVEVHVPDEDPMGYLRGVGILIRLRLNRD